MRRVVLGILVSATMALSACGAGTDDAEPKMNEESCGYDLKTLMPAVKAAVSPDATVRVTMEMSGAGTEMAFDAVIALTPAGAAMDLTSRTPGDEFALVLVDNRFFMSDSPGGGTYEEIDSSNPAAAELRALVANMDLESTFAAWDAGLEKVERIGEEKIEGVGVCHYSLTINTAEAAAAQGQSLPRGMPKTINYELFLTREDLMRRVVFSLSGIKAEMNLSSWNEPVDIKVPRGH